MKFVKESELEKRIRELLEKELENNPHFSVLESKKVTDIVICREDIPRAFFLEVKLHTSRKGRMGIGEAKGKGFQPDIIKEKHQYFEKYLRWVLCNDEIENERKFVFASTETIRKNLVGGQVGQKQNNIRPRIFGEETLLTETNLIERLISWLKTADYI